MGTNKNIFLLTFRNVNAILALSYQTNHDLDHEDILLWFSKRLPGGPVATQGMGEDTL